MKSITLETAFYTNEYSETPYKTVLSFMDEDILRIRHLQQIAEKENVTIRMDFVEEQYLNEDEEECEWRSDFSCIQIYSNGSLYYYAQGKYDSADQFETEIFTLESLNTNCNETKS